MGTTADKLQYLAQTKEMIRSAIAAKGVGVSVETPFREYPALIERFSSLTDEELSNVNQELAMLLSETDEQWIEKLDSFDLTAKIRFLRLCRATILNKIMTKGVAVPEIQPFRTIHTLIEKIESGGAETIVPKDVNFYDYDGTLLHSYSLAEANAMTALPDSPVHSGLIFQGWNWKLEEINALTGPMDVGAVYITDDGKTRLHIKIGDASRSRVPLCISQTLSHGVTIDWGDGSTPETLDGTGYVETAHQYPGSGNYTISLTVADSCDLGFGTGVHDSSVMGGISDIGYVFQNMLQQVNIGSGVSRISPRAFLTCHNVASATVPDGVTGIADSAFNGCYRLQSIVIPRSVSSLGERSFAYCYQLAGISIPNSIPGIAPYTFTDCYNLATVKIPDSVTAIGNYAFNRCHSLVAVKISDCMKTIGANAFSVCHSLVAVKIPDSVETIGASAFVDCDSLVTLNIPDSVTAIGEGMLGSCSSLESVTLPAGLTVISATVFNYCQNLTSVTIPDSVTSIGQSAFQYCSGLAGITIPEHVTSIGIQAFWKVPSIAEYHMKPAVPPQLVSKDCFTGIPADCVIYVPRGSLEAYQTAANWSAYASYMREEP